jgi:hypothetical protein
MPNPTNPFAGKKTLQELSAEALAALKCGTRENPAVVLVENVAQAACMREVIRRVADVQRMDRSLARVDVQAAPASAPVSVPLPATSELLSV